MHHYKQPYLLVGRVPTFDTSLEFLF